MISWSPLFVRLNEIIILYSSATCECFLRQRHNKEFAKKWNCDMIHGLASSGLFINETLLSHPSARYGNAREKILQIERTAFLTRHEWSSHPIVRMKERNPSREIPLIWFTGCVKSRTYSIKTPSRTTACFYRCCRGRFFHNGATEKCLRLFELGLMCVMTCKYNLDAERLVSQFTFWYFSLQNT